MYLEDSVVLAGANPGRCNFKCWSPLGASACLRRRTGFRSPWEGCGEKELCKLEHWLIFLSL